MIQDAFSLVKDRDELFFQLFVEVLTTLVGDWRALRMLDLVDLSLQAHE